MLERPPFFARVLDALLQDGASGTIALDSALADGPSGQARIDALRDPWMLHAYGITPLCQAVWKRNLDAVQRLLEVSPTLALDITMDGHTPLMIASRYKDPSIAMALLPVSDLLAREPVFHETALDQIVLHAHEALVEHAVPYLVRTPRTEEGQTFLMLAAAQGPVHAVRHLLPVSDVNAQDLQGRTALMLAVDHGLHENVRALLPWAHRGLADGDGRNVVERFQRSLAQQDGQRLISRDDWACLDLLGLFESEHPAMVQMASDASPKVLPLWHDQDQAQRIRREILMEREVPELQAAIEEVTVSSARARIRL